MKLRFALLLSLISVSVFAQETCDHRPAVQAAIATGGNLSIGIADYTERTELGATISGTMNNASAQTNNVTPSLFAGLRYALREATYFAWGLDLTDTFGTQNGGHIDADYQVAPYISLEQMLTKNLMLSGWIQPYQYQYEKISGNSTTTQSFFNGGGIGLNYLF